MNRMQHKLGLLIGLLLILVIAQPALAAPPARAPQRAVAAPSQDAMEFKVTYNNGRYEVFMRPNVTPADPNLTLTSQVTLKVPHGTGADRFEVTDVVNSVAGTEWTATSRVDAPSEDTSADYISFTVAFPEGNHSAYQWAAGEEIQIFSFANSGTCLDSVTLLENSDPFMAPNNSANTNPGNQIDILGMEEGNRYSGNYGAAADCTATAPVTTGYYLPLIRR